MADYWTRFKKRWAATGVIAEPTVNQADTGFGYLGSTAPSVELFNALLQAYDEKDNWLFQRMEEVMLAAGITPSAATPNQLLNALRQISGPGMASFGATQQFQIPAGVSRIKVQAWGGGGGGGGAFGPTSAGSGGGAGGYTAGIFTVTPSAIFMVTVGAGGAGAPLGSIYAAGPGGTSSFGSLCGATGGAPGIGGNQTIAGGAAVIPGYGYGGAWNVSGSVGGYGQHYVGGNMGGGIGGAAPMGGGLSPLSIGGSGNPGIYPGGGGSGGGGNPLGGYMAGGSGGWGLVVVEW